jgi:predicted nucleic acid-binding protein
VSDFAAAEFSSVIARMVRMDLVPADEARAIFNRFDAWLARSAQAAHVAGIDVQTATAVVRRLDLNIHAPDAINLAITQRLGAAVVTFDRRMADNAQALGIAVTVI